MNTPIQAGSTVTHPHFPLLGLPEQAVVVEVHETGQAELDNGQALPAEELTLVETGEQWVDVAGYEGKYRLSDQGRLVATSYNRRVGRQRLLKAQRPTTYPFIELSNGPALERVGINRLVAQHFLPAPTDASHDHLVPLDGNQLNLSASNWRWAPEGEAKVAAVIDRYHAKGKPYSLGKLSAAQRADIREQVAQGRTYQSLADEHGVSKPAAWRAAKPRKA